MITSNLRELIEEQTGPLLLVAGGFLVIQLMLNALPGLIGVSLYEQLPAWAGYLFSSGLLGLVGLAIPFVALLGLYCRLTPETPRVAVVGGALMALTPVLFVTGLLTTLVLSQPDLVVLLWLSPLPYMVGAGLFALTFLQRSGSIRLVGIPLFVFSGTWTLTYAVGLKTGGLPGQLPFVELLAVSVIAMGYLLTTSSTTPDSTVPAGR